jgi:hypothetical protein
MNVRLEVDLGKPLGNVNENYYTLTSWLSTNLKKRDSNALCLLTFADRTMDTIFLTPDVGYPWMSERVVTGQYLGWGGGNLGVVGVI